MFAPALTGLPRNGEPPHGDRPGEREPARSGGGAGQSVPGDRVRSVLLLAAWGLLLLFAAHMTLDGTTNWPVFPLIPVIAAFTGLALLDHSLARAVIRYRQ